VLHRFDFTEEFGSAAVALADGLLDVSTGELRRRWRWTGRGLVSVGLDDLVNGRS
jgi:hypothetical protein